MASESQPDLLPLGEVLRVGLRHKRLILVCVVLGLLGGLLYFLFIPPLYLSKAKLLVVKKEPYRFASSVESQVPQLQDDDEIHISVLTSPMFIERTVDRMKLRELQTFQGTSDPAGAILPRLSVARVSVESAAARGNSHVISVGFTGPLPGDCPKVVGAIIGSYREYLDETAQRINEEAITRITKKADDVRQELRLKEAEYQTFRAKMPPAAKEGMLFHKARITEIENQRTALAVRRAQVQRKIDVAAVALASGKELEGLLAIINEPSRRELGIAMRQTLTNLMVREAELLKQFGADHPDVQLVRKQIEMVRKLYVPGAPVGSPGATPEQQVSQRPEVRAYMEQLNADLKDVESSEQELNRSLAEEQAKARELERHEFQDQQFSADIARSQQFYQSLIDQLGGVDLSKGMIGYDTTVLSPARYAAMVRPNWIWAFAVPAFTSLLLGCGLAWIAEASDHSFRSPEDIVWRIGLPVVAHIPVIDRQTMKQGRALARSADVPLDAILCTFYQPLSAVAEAFRALRAAICFPSHRERFRVIQVSSPNVGDGKTAVACNLAVSLAQLGNRVLLIDGDLRAPRVHQIFGLANDLGLTTVSEGKADFSVAASDTAIRGLWVLPTGPQVSNPADLLSSAQFETLLKEARAQYDYVIVDTPALLAVTDPRVVAPLVDGLLLTIRVVKNGRPKVERACEILGMIQANLLGVVVNGKDCYAHYSSDGYEDHAGHAYQATGSVATAALTRD
jgi:capsular exopolysaccharide synthesis family protein